MLDSERVRFSAWELKMKREQLKHMEPFPPLTVEMRGGVGHSSNRKYFFDRSYRLYEAEGGTQWGLTAPWRM